MQETIMIACTLRLCEMINSGVGSYREAGGKTRHGYPIGHH